MSGTMDGEQRITSLDIAQITGKPHNDVLKAIRKMETAWEKVHQGKFSQMQIRIELPNGGFLRGRRRAHGEGHGWVRW